MINVAKFCRAAAPSISQPFHETFLFGNLLSIEDNRLGSGDIWEAFPFYEEDPFFVLKNHLSRADLIMHISHSGKFISFN